MILSVYGDGMGEFAQSAAAIPLPLNLAGFQASVNGVPTPLYYVSHAQVNIQIPYETQPGPATLTLGNPFQNFSYRFTVAGTAPGIFTFADDTINPSSSGRRGDVVTLFLTGDGQVAPRLATGTTPSITTPLLNLPKPVAVFRLTVAGIAVTPEFIGIPSGLVGVTQVNFRIPASAPVGLQDVVVTIGDQPSNNAKILVQ
jgi:uncharacterized protein (TIGR03437 family)